MHSEKWMTLVCCQNVRASGDLEMVMGQVYQFKMCQSVYQWSRFSILFNTQNLIMNLKIFANVL